MGSQALILLLSALAIVTVECNFEGDVLHAWKTVLADPNNVLQSWDPTLVNPCTWYHVTCNNDNIVTRVDLGNAGLSGPLVPQLGLLKNLQYLELFDNNFTGVIPKEIGDLTMLISLDLYQNALSGTIPASLGKLKHLRFLRLNSNKLSGNIPTTVIQLVQWGNLNIMNVSDNQLMGSVHHHNKTEFAVTTIIQDPKA